MDVLAIQRESLENFITLLDGSLQDLTEISTVDNGKTGAPPLPEPPAPSTYGTSARGAEEFVTAWLKSRGHLEAKTTQYSKDGGVDIVTSSWVVQVKLYSQKNVSVQEVREIFGIASSVHRGAAIFTSSAFTSEAKKFAEVSGVALATFDPYSSSFYAENQRAKELFLPPNSNSEHRAAHQQLVGLNLVISSKLFPILTAARSLLATMNYSEKNIDAALYDFELRGSTQLSDKEYLNSLTLQENEEAFRMLRGESNRITEASLRLVKKTQSILETE